MCYMCVYKVYIYKELHVYKVRKCYKLKLQSYKITSLLNLLIYKV